MNSPVPFLSHNEPKEQGNLWQHQLQQQKTSNQDQNGSSGGAGAFQRQGTTPMQSSRFDAEKTKLRAFGAAAHLNKPLQAVSRGLSVRNEKERSK